MAAGTTHACRDSPCHHNLNEHNAQVDYIITHEPPASLKDCLGVDMQQRLEIHTFFEDIIKQCSYRKWFFGKCHMDRFIPMKFYAMFEDVLPVESESRRRSRKQTAPEED